MRSQDIWTAVSKVDCSKWTALPVHSASAFVEPGKLWFPSGDAGNQLGEKKLHRIQKPPVANGAPSLRALPMA